VTKINLQQLYQEIISEVESLVRARAEQSSSGNTTTLYMGNKYVGIRLSEKWIEVCFYDLQKVGNDGWGEWDEILLSFTLQSEASEVEANIFVTSVVTAIKAVYYWWVDVAKPLPQFIKESWNPKEGNPVRKGSNG